MTTRTEQFAAHFDLSDHKKKPSSGQDLTYVPTDKYIERLNAVLGDGWSWQIQSCLLDPEKRFAQVVGVISYRNEDGSTSEKAGVGVSQDLTKSQKEELDKILKSANSEAIKNAAKLLGIGLYMYDKEELAAVEQEMRQPRKSTQAKRADPDRPTEKELWDEGNRLLRAVVTEIAKRDGVHPTKIPGYMTALITDLYKQTSSTKCTGAQLRQLAEDLRSGKVALVPTLDSIAADVAATELEQDPMQQAIEANKEAINA